MGQTLTSDNSLELYRSIWRKKVRKGLTTKVAASDKSWERLTGVLIKNIQYLTLRMYAADIQQKSQFLKNSMTLGLVRNCTSRSALGFFCCRLNNLRWYNVLKHFCLYISCCVVERPTQGCPTHLHRGTHRRRGCRIRPFEGNGEANVAPGEN